MSEMCCERGTLAFWGCKRDATVVRDGRPYCDTHDPEAIEKENERKRIEYQKRKDEEEQHELVRAYRLVAAVIGEASYISAQAMRNMADAIEHELEAGREKQT